MLKKSVFLTSRNNGKNVIDVSTGEVVKIYFSTSCMTNSVMQTDIGEPMGVIDIHLKS